MHSGSPAIVGTGLVALDVILRDESDSPILAAGGTCGNVLAILAAWGWDSYPVSRLADDPPARRVLDDLADCGVHLDFTQLEPRRSVPVFIEKLKSDGTHRFSTRCPKCKGWLPRYSPVTAAAIRDAQPSLPSADVFFFDRASRGALDLAESYKERGALVVFEPSAATSRKHLEQAVELADVAKYSVDRFDGLTTAGELPDGLTLEIATMGASGVRFRGHLFEQPRVWRRSPANRAAKVVDTAGAGDWFTAALLQLLIHEELTRSGETGISQIIEAAQAIAAESVQHVGARGAMGRIKRPAPVELDSDYCWKPLSVSEFQCVACGV